MDKLLPVSYNQPKFCPSATWDPNAITFAYESTVGSQPAGIFVDSNDTVYVANQEKGQILVWRNDSIDLARTIPDGLSNPYSIFVTANGDIYVGNDIYLNDKWNYYVDKWASSTYITFFPMFINSSCYALFIDVNDSSYCSLYDSHTVVKWSNGNQRILTVVAGTSINGSTSNELSSPAGIFVDINFDLYVADCGNNRIQLFRSGQLNGTTVAGNGSLNTTILLNCPTGVVLDADKYLFIVDRGNHRIVRSNSNGFRCLVACSGSGTASYQLYQPRTLSFDNYGNIYVTDSGNRRIQKFVLSSNSCTVSYNQPKFCPSATWNPNATTFANESTVGSGPTGIFVDSNNTVYIGNQESGQILVWLNNSINPTRIISGDLSSPYSIFVTANGDIYVADDDLTHRVGKWTLKTNTIVPVIYVNSTCSGLFIDINDTLYCSMYYDHQVVKKSLGDKMETLTTAAGTSINGSTTTMLSLPAGIFVDINFDLYVADSANNRVQLFRSGQLNGTTVAGNGSLNTTISLKCPFGIVLDADKYLFIVDSGNNRIVGQGPSGFRCLVGCSESDSAFNQLKDPWSLSFDSYGNMFVTDYNNSRIQKFLLSTDSCDETMTSQATHTSTKTYAISSTALETLNLSTIATTISHQHEITTSITTVKPTSTIDFNEPVSITLSLTTTSVETTRPEILSFGTKLVAETTATGNTSRETTAAAEATTIETTPVKSSVVVTTKNKSVETTVVTETTIAGTTEVQTIVSTKAAPAVTTMNQLPPKNFVPTPCNNSKRIGTFCNISNTLCDTLQPCQNNGSCNNNDNVPHGYVCLCPSGFDGTLCQIDYRPCQPNTCWNNGTCYEISNSTFACRCEAGWHGTKCEIMDNYCKNITCFNNGVCRPLFLNYSCECLGESFSGPHCEETAFKIKIYQMASKSFAYIAIIAMTSVVMFIVIMDILKYCFGIDPTREEVERFRRRKRAKNRKPVIQHFVYINAPEPPIVPTEETAS